MRTRPRFILAVFALIPLQTALATPEDFVLKTVAGRQTAVTSLKLSAPTTVKIRIVKRGNTELGVWMYNPERNVLLNGAAPTGHGNPINPAQVWQANGNSTANNNEPALHRDVRKLKEKDVVTYAVREYKYAGNQPGEDVAIAINSYGAYLDNAAISTAVSLTKKDHFYHLVLSDGWELDIKIVFPDSDF